MADTTILELNKLTTGSHSGTWGDLTNDNMSKIDTSIKGYSAVAITGTTQTLTTGSAGTGYQINNESLKFTDFYILLYSLPNIQLTNVICVSTSDFKKIFF